MLWIRTINKLSDYHGKKIALNAYYLTRKSPTLILTNSFHQTTQTNNSENNNGTKITYAVTDLCDAYVKSPERLQAAEAGILFDFGGKKAFHGQIETVRCFESNPLVRKTLGGPGQSRVLVVDGGGSKRVAILGDQLASMAHANNWSGIVINGCIRDSTVISRMPIGVKALGKHPIKSIKTHEGERGGIVAFAGLEFRPGHWLYADEDGLIVSDKELSLDAN